MVVCVALYVRITASDIIGLCAFLNYELYLLWKFKNIAGESGTTGLMLLRGVSPKIINEALGHASVAFTMDTYSHIIKGMREKAIKLLDEVLPGGNLESNHYKITAG